MIGNIAQTNKQIHKQKVTKPLDTNVFAAINRKNKYVLTIAHKLLKPDRI